MTSESLTLRPPRPEDGAAMWRLTGATGVLDLNSPYAYLMVGRFFADTSVVAILDGALVGFVSGFRPPGRSEVLFVWQVGVDAAARGRGVAGRMLDDLLQRPTSAGVHRLETTVTPSNGPSDSLFRSFARRHDAEVELATGFAANLFPPGEGDHEKEVLYGISPLSGGVRREANQPS